GRGASANLVPAPPRRRRLRRKAARLSSMRHPTTRRIGCGNPIYAVLIEKRRGDVGEWDAPRTNRTPPSTGESHIPTPHSPALPYESHRDIPDHLQRLSRDLVDRVVHRVPVGVIAVEVDHVDRVDAGMLEHRVVVDQGRPGLLEEYLAITK